jgi:pyrroline-5-carboxylate reductase
MKKLGFIGGGNMAEALARGLLDNQVFTPEELFLADVDAARRRKISRTLKVDTTADNRAVRDNSRALLIAVKPQQIDEVMAELAAEAVVETMPAARKRVAKAVAKASSKASGNQLSDRLYISIAAGITLKRLTEGLKTARVVRVMPNAPAMVGQGMAALAGASGITKADEAFALKIFRAVGDAVALKEERLLDAVTALSGSGPAYFYLFIKALADSAVSEGLPAELAIRMALKTMRGAEENMRRSPLDAAELIRIVASPGGTTEAALRKFAEAGFSDIVAAAVRAAAERSRELGRS